MIMTATLAITAKCTVRPHRHGNHLRMPVGFRANVQYKVVGGTYPNGTQDLHFLVVDDAGTVKTMLASDVSLIPS